jgi:hypothetical protein
MQSTLFKAFLVWGTGVCLFFGTSAIAGWKFPWPKSTGGYYGTSGGRSSYGTWGGGK